MALGAFFFGHGRVNIVIENAIFVRTVGVVAGGAVTAGHLVIHMSPFKESAIGFVALGTQRGYFFSQ